MCLCVICQYDLAEAIDEGYVRCLDALADGAHEKMTFWTYMSR